MQKDIGLIDNVLDIYNKKPLINQIHSSQTNWSFWITCFTVGRNSEYSITVIQLRARKKYNLLMEKSIKRVYFTWLYC